jgi:hypothetical protein
MALKMVELLAFPEKFCDPTETAQDFCDRAVAAINQYSRNYESREMST